MSSAFGGGYSNPPLGLMDRVKNFFDKRDAQAAENENHRRGTESMAMQHQMALEQMHVRHGYDKDIIETTGRVTRRNTSHAAKVSTLMPEGSSLSTTPNSINVTAPPPSRKTRTTKPAAPSTKAAAPKTAAPKTASAPKTPKTTTAAKAPKVAAAPKPATTRKPKS